MKQAYDFALEHVGIDFHSSTIWADYIHFLKSEYVSFSLLTVLSPKNGIQLWYFIFLSLE